MDSKTNRKLDWRVLLAGAVGVLMIAPVFVVHRCDEWIGFCEDTTREESVEKNAKGQIQKRTEITKYQSGKTLWDGLELAGTLAVPVLLLYLGNQFQRRDQERAENQAELEREIAAANLRDEALQDYLDRIAELLLNQEFRKELFPTATEDPNSDNSVRDVARIRTVTILRRLEEDKERQARVLHFLGDAELLEFLFKSVNLEGAILWGANLEEAYLEEAYLEGAIECTADQIKAANNWEKAYYSPGFRQELGLTPELSEANKDKS